MQSFKLTPKIISEIAADYKAGLEGQTLASKYNISRFTLSVALRKVGITPQRRDKIFTSRELPAETLTAIIEAYKAGETHGSIQLKYGISYTLLNRLLIDAGVKTRKLRLKPLVGTDRSEHKVIERKGSKNDMVVLSKTEQAEICRKYIEGADNKISLAKEYHVDLDTITAILRKQGIASKRFVPLEIIEQFCNDFDEGNTSIYDLSAIYRIAPTTIKFWLVKRGYNIAVDGPAPAQGVKAGQVRKRAREASVKALQALIDIVEDPSEETKDRIAASKLIMERGLGKPKEEDDDHEEDTGTLASGLLKLVPKAAANIVKG